mmetsp:Transcript_37429/g.57340  ORF Transcript_37429/g.57340 Transcript_37429/m.57340 type:complete len:89 (+) Transcript_37429:2692-2958(+)
MEHVLRASNSFQQVFKQEKHRAELSRIDRNERKDTQAAAKKRRKTEKLPQINKSTRMNNRTQEQFFASPDQPPSQMIEQMVIDGSDMH